MNINNTISVNEYIKKYHKDFYGQPDAKFPKREYELKMGIPRCYDTIWANFFNPKKTS